MNRSKGRTNKWGWEQRLVVATLLLAFLGPFLLPPLISTIRLYTRLPAGALRHFSTSQSTFSNQISRLCPPGTPIEEAKSIMELRGFRCDYKKFGNNRPFLSCSKAKGMLRISGWAVTFKFDDENRVTRFNSGVGLYQIVP